MTPRVLRSCVGVVLAVLGSAHCKGGSAEPSAPTSPAPVDGGSAPAAPAGELGGTSWKLVQFEGGDGTVLTPAPGARYTLAFGADGRVSARIDCNRGTASWTSAAPPMLELGPLALTRATCPPGSMHDQIVRQWPYVRSYVLRDGHLFLSLMADGGIYEYAPASP